MAQLQEDDNEEIKNADEDNSESEYPLVSMIPSSNVPKSESEENRVEITVQRPALTVDKKQNMFLYERKPDEKLCDRIKKKMQSNVECSPNRIKRIATNRIPLLDWLPKYDIKKNLTGDCIAGVTVSVMHIPQGMAYAMLAGLDPIHGIYMAFFPVLAYAIFGTSRHCSVGTFAVICIMTGKVVQELSTVNPDSESFLAATQAQHATGYTPVEVATLCSFAVGIWLMILGFAQTGSLSVFFSDMLVSGFTTGAAIHVLTSQVKHLFGLSIRSPTGNFKLIKTYIIILKNITSTNITTLVMSILCLLILISNNELLKPRLQKYTKFPVPIELILVIVGTLISQYWNISPAYGVFVVGPIPTGLPLPKLPRMNLLGALLIDSLIIAIVSYTISYAMAKILAKDNYKVNPTQELYAHGISNFVGSLFACAPVSTSLSRSLIQTSVGGKTQMTSFVSCSILLMVLLYIGPFFETLPNCVLGSIIIVALKGMLLQVKDFVTILKISSLDASIWLITFLTVVIVDIDCGLLIGVFMTVIVLLLRNQSVQINVLGRYAFTDIYLDKNRYARVVEVTDFKICGVSGNLHFANQSIFMKTLIKSSGVDPQNIVKIKSKQNLFENGNHKMKRDSSSYSQDIYENGIVISSKDDVIIDDLNKRHSFSQDINGEAGFKENPTYPSVKKDATSLDMKTSEIKYLIIDLSGVGNIDASAARNLKSLQDIYKTASITVAYTGVTDCLMETLSATGVLKDMSPELLIYSIHDAISILSARNNAFEESVRL